MTPLSLKLGIKIRGAGAFVPADHLYTNMDLLRRHPEFQGQSDVRLGIFARRIQDEYGFATRALVHEIGTPLRDDELTSEDLGRSALDVALAATQNWTPDVFIFGTTTTSRYTGSQAAALSGAVGWQIPSYETRAGCSTSLASLNLAFAFMKSGLSRAAVVCAETLSKVVNPAQRDDWFGLADGAASLLFEADANQPDFRVLKTVFFTKGQFVDLYSTTAHLPPSQGGFDRGGYYLAGDAAELRAQSLRGYEELLEILLPTKAERAEVRWLVPHQVNMQMIAKLKGQLAINGEDVVSASRVGNLGGTSVLFSLAEALNQNRFKKGDKILLMSVGGGLSVAGQLWEKC